MAGNTEVKTQGNNGQKEVTYECCVIKMVIEANRQVTKHKDLFQSLLLKL